MRKPLLKATALCTVGLLAGLALAQEGAREERRKRAAARERAGQRGERRARPDRGKAMLEKLMEELKLTEKQEAPVRQILTTYQQELASWTRQNGPAMRELYTKLRGGRGRRGQEPAEPAKRVSEAERKEAAAKLRELQKKRAAITENVLKQLKEHLTEEQMAAARRILGRGQRRGPAVSFAMLRRLDLTAEQQAKVKEIMASAREAAKGQEGRARGQAYTDAMQKIVKDVLTAEQREKLETMRSQAPQRRAGGMFAGLDLTEEQQKKIRKIQASMREKISAAEGREARREAYQAMQKEIQAVLTPEQLEKLQQRRKEMRDRPRRDRPDRGNR